MFCRIILVATGSGIGSYADPVRLLWTSPNVGESFSDVFVDQTLHCALDVFLYDTRKHGKPGLVKFVLRMVMQRWSVSFPASASPKSWCTASLPRYSRLWCHSPTVL